MFGEGEGFRGLTGGVGGDGGTVGGFVTLDAFFSFFYVGAVDEVKCYGQFIP